MGPCRCIIRRILTTHTCPRCKVVLRLQDTILAWFRRSNTLLPRTLPCRRVRLLLTRFVDKTPSLKTCRTHGYVPVVYFFQYAARFCLGSKEAGSVMRVPNIPFLLASSPPGILRVLLCASWTTMCPLKLSRAVLQAYQLTWISV